MVEQQNNLSSILASIEKKCPDIIDIDEQDEFNEIK